MVRPAPAPVPGSAADIGAVHGGPVPRTEAEIWALLAQIPDPEIPVITITDLGIVRAVSLDVGSVRVTITPTYSGCPATGAIARTILQVLTGAGLKNVVLETQIDPPWTTDWMTDAGREKLRRYGIAPPSGKGPAACPRCGSAHVTRVSQFGSTPCKASWRCDACLEPFDYFKCH